MNIEITADYIGLNYLWQTSPHLEGSAAFSWQCENWIFQYFGILWKAGNIYVSNKLLIFPEDTMVSEFRAWLWYLIKSSIMLWKHTWFCTFLDRRRRFFSTRKEFMELSAAFYGFEQQATASCPNQKVFKVQCFKEVQEKDPFSWAT